MGFEKIVMLGGTRKYFHKRGTILSNALALTPAWISNYIHSTVWEKLISHSQTSKVQERRKNRGEKVYVVYNFHLGEYMAFMKTTIIHMYGDSYNH